MNPSSFFNLEPGGTGESAKLFGGADSPDIQSLNSTADLHGGRHRGDSADSDGDESVGSVDFNGTGTFKGGGAFIVEFNDTQFKSINEEAQSLKIRSATRCSTSTGKGPASSPQFRNSDCLNVTTASFLPTWLLSQVDMTGGKRKIAAEWLKKKGVQAVTHLRKRHETQKKLQEDGKAAIKMCSEMHQGLHSLKHHKHGDHRKSEIAGGGGDSHVKPSKDTVKTPPRIDKDDVTSKDTVKTSSGHDAVKIPPRIEKDDVSVGTVAEPAQGGNVVPKQQRGRRRGDGEEAAAAANGKTHSHQVSADAITGAGFASASSSLGGNKNVAASIPSSSMPLDIFADDSLAGELERNLGSSLAASQRQTGTLRVLGGSINPSTPVVSSPVSADRVRNTNFASAGNNIMRPMSPQVQTKGAPALASVTTSNGSLSSSSSTPVLTNRS